MAVFSIMSSACVPVHQVHALPPEARREHQISLELELQQLGDIIWVLGIELRFVERQAHDLNYHLSSPSKTVLKSLK